MNASRCSFEDWNLENDIPRPDLDNNSERIREECWNGDEAFEVRVTVGLPLPSTPSFLPLIFFPQLGHDSSNSRNWSCNNLLSGIHRRSSPDQSVIILLPFLPSPGYTWPSHAESQSSPLNPSLSLSLLPLTRKIVSKGEVNILDVAQKRSFPNNEFTHRVFFFFLIKRIKPRKKEKERRCGDALLFVCTKRGTRILLLSSCLLSSSMDRAFLSFFSFNSNSRSQLISSTVFYSRDSRTPASRLAAGWHNL